MAIVNTTDNISVNSLSQADKDRIRGAITELNDSYVRVDAERDYQKTVLETLHDAIGIDKKLVRKLAKTYYKSNFNSEKEEYQTFEDFYSIVIQGTGKNV